MSRQALPAISDEDLDLAVSAELGGESRVFFSYDQIRLVADVEMDAPATGTLIADNTYRAPSGGVGRDMQVICNGPVLSTAAIVLTFGVSFAPTAAAVNIATVATGNPGVVNTSTVHGLTTGDTVTIAGNTGSTPDINGSHTVTVTDTDSFTLDGVNVTVAGTGGTVTKNGATGQAVATFAPPDTAQDQSFNFPPGLAVDLIGTAGNSTAKIVSVNSLVSITGGAAGDKFYVAACPEASSYVEVACVTDKTIDIPTPKSIAIPCRFNGARWVKKGRSEPPNLEFKAKHGSYGDGLSRANGHRVTVKMEARKDDRILTERLIFGGYRPTVKLNKPDGDGEADATATGMYELFAAFV